MGGARGEDRESIRWVEGYSCSSSHFIFATMFYLSINSPWGKSELVWDLTE